MSADDLTKSERCSEGTCVECVRTEVEDLRAQLAAWKSRFRALVDEDNEADAGNAVLSMQRQLATARDEA